MLAEGLAAVCNSGEHRWEPQLYRLKGELLLIQALEKCGSHPAPPDTSMLAEAEEEMTDRSPPPMEAEVCLRQALAIACRQQAKSLELRAVMSLSRLWQQQGKRQQARQLLANICSWFTQGFSTADLQEARAWLEELA